MNIKNLLLICTVLIGIIWGCNQTDQVIKHYNNFRLLEDTAYFLRVRVKSANGLAKNIKEQILIDSALQRRFSPNYRFELKQIVKKLETMAHEAKQIEKQYTQWRAEWDKTLVEVELYAKKQVGEDLNIIPEKQPDEIVQAVDKLLIQRDSVYEAAVASFYRQDSVFKIYGQIRQKAVKKLRGINSEKNIMLKQ